MRTAAPVGTCMALKEHWLNFELTVIGVTGTQMLLTAVGTAPTLAVKKTTSVYIPSLTPEISAGVKCPKIAVNQIS